MATFLRKCEQCGVMIARGHACPECHWCEQPEGEAETARPPMAETLHEFARRERAHMRNYAIFMMLMIGTGLIGLLTGWMWIRFIFFGSIRAFFLIGFFTLVTGGLAVMLKLSKKMFPTELLCPGCDVRLDQMGTIGDNCPSCSAVLKPGPQHAAVPQ